jgi:hypothetical protein
VTPPSQILTNNPLVNAGKERLSPGQSKVNAGMREQQSVFYERAGKRFRENFRHASW